MTLTHYFLGFHMQNPSISKKAKTCLVFETKIIIFLVRISDRWDKLSFLELDQMVVRSKVMTLSQHVTTAQAYFIQYYVQVYYT